jgi:PAS domain S-box-containing protein
MGGRIRAFDWAATSLGPLETWPQSLKTSVDLLLHSPVPMVLLWGPDGVMIYNDAYSGFAGGRHPGLLGSKVLQGWPEVADFNRRVMEVGLAGGTLSFRDQQLVLHRNGVPEGVWMNLDYSPIRDESGRPAGVLAIVVETSERIHAEQRVTFMLELAERLLSLSDPAEIKAAAAEALGRRLGVGRAGYGEVDQAGVNVTVERDWTDGAFSSLAGESRPLDSFGPAIIEVLREGRTLRLDDIAADPRSAPYAEGYASIGARSMVVAPMIREGRLKAILYLHEPRPRRWTDLDVGLVEDVAARTWSSVERARTEAALRESEARFRSIADSAPAPVFMTDPAGALAFVNRAFEEFAGIRAGDLPGGIWTTLLHPEDLPFVAERRRQAWIDHSPYQFEARFKGAGGAWLWMLVSARPRLDGAGMFQGYVGMAVDLTERRRAEAELRESETQLSLLADALPLLVSFVDKDERYRLVNKTYEDWFGEPRAEIIGRTIGEVLGPEAHLVRGPQIEAALRGERLRFEALTPAPGGARETEVQYLPRAGPDGRVEGFYVVVTDITERKAAEEALRLRGEEFHALADNIPTLCWTAYGDGHIYWYNRRWYEYTGASPDDQEGWGWESAHDPVVLPRVVERWEHSIATGEPFEMTFPLKGADAIFRPFLTRVVPIRDETGAVVRWFGTNVDVSEQQRFAEELERLVAERTAERDRIWRASSELMAVAGVDGYLKAVNPAWSRVLGYGEAELLARPFTDLIHPQDLPGAAEVLAGLAEGRPVVRFEDRLRAADGEWRWISWTATPGEGVFYAVGRDVTEEKAITEELQATEESLRQAQKMEAVGQLTGGIAHDFNNLLTAVVGGLDMIGRRATDERTKRIAANALQAAERGAKLTSQLLAFSRTQRLAVEPVPVNAAIKRMAELLAGALGSTIELELRLDPAVGAALTDANQLELAVLNLAINARDALGGAGKVTVATRSEQVGPDQALAPGLAAGGYVVVSVSDDGPGMGPDVLARAFDPFYTTKPVGQGTGLGLSQVYGIARQSGGAAVIASELGRGATVSIFLPVAANLERAADAPPGEMKASRGVARGAVLVVDDDPDVRRFIVDSLDTLGFRVIEAEDGPSGLELFERERPDLLLLDFAMPGMNGAEVAERARRLRPGQRVLFASGYADTAAIEQAAGDAAVLRKPFRLTDLAAAVKGALA